MTNEKRIPYEGQRILEAMQEAVRYGEAILTQIRAAMPPGATRVLDFGAGDGFFADRFLRLGLPLACVEPDPHLRSKLEARSIPTYWDIADVESESLDFIYTINVLEHIGELERTCAELHRVLRPGGGIFVFVPAFELLWTSLDDEVGHVRRFTRESLRASLGAHFTIERIRFFDSLGFPAALTVRVLEGLGLFKYESGKVKLYDRLIFPVSRALDRVTDRFIGKNLLLVGRKPN